MQALDEFGPQLLWDPPQRGASWAAVAVNLAVGIGWIVGFAYVVVDAADLVARDVDIVGKIRYR